MDYLDHVKIDRHVSWRAFSQWRRDNRRRLVLLTTRAQETLWDFAFREDDVIMVGRESAGAPREVHDDADARVRIAIRPPLRSLNVGVAAALALGEAMRQIGRVGGATG
jgi:tRNA (cytidine/uridine-2'-O-)-methyltransferase